MSNIMTVSDQLRKVSRDSGLLNKTESYWDDGERRRSIDYEIPGDYLVREEYDCGCLVSLFVMTKTEAMRRLRG